MIFLSLVTIPSNLGLDQYKVSHRSWSSPCFMCFVLPFLNNKTIYFQPFKLFQKMCSGSHLNTSYLAEYFAILHLLHVLKAEYLISVRPTKLIRNLTVSTKNFTQIENRFKSCYQERVDVWKAVSYFQNYISVKI